MRNQASTQKMLLYVGHEWKSQGEFGIAPLLAHSCIVNLLEIITFQMALSANDKSFCFSFVSFLSISLLVLALHILYPDQWLWGSW